MKKKIDPTLALILAASAIFRSSLPEHVQEEMKNDLEPDLCSFDWEEEAEQFDGYGPLGDDEIEPE